MPAKGERGQIIIPRVHLFQCGPWQGEDYTERHLREMVENFRRFSSGPNPLVHVPVVIGHEEEQDLLRNTGLPAVGYAETLEQDGIDLFGDLSQIFPDIADLIEAGAYEHVSAEIYPPDRLPEGVPARGHMLRRIALLGGQLPHIKQLSDLPRPIRRMAERLRRRSPRVRLHSAARVFYPDAGTWACFSEVTAMAESALKEAAISAVKNLHPDLPDEFLGSLSDDQIAMLAAPAEEAPPEGEPGATPMQEPGVGAGAPVVWPDGKDRPAIEAELAAMGEDPAALAAMSDEDLLALYQQKAGATPMSEGDLFDPLEDDDVPQTTPARQPAKVTVTQQFSERRVAALEKRLKQAEAFQRKQEQLARQLLAAQRDKVVRAFCEELSDAGKASAAEVEFDRATGKPIGPIAIALSIASPVRKFGEGGASELDALMETFRKRPRRNFSEQVADPVQGSGGGTLSQERERQLLAHTRAGKRVLAQREQQAANHRVFAETMGEVLRRQQNGHN